MTIINKKSLPRVMFRSISIVVLTCLLTGTPAIVPAAAASKNCVYNSFYVGDALVHSATSPNNTDGKPPFVFVPGLNLASYIFCATPDGREGWGDYFCEAGRHDVFVINDPDFDFRKGSAGVVTPKWTVPTDDGSGPPAQASSSQGWQRDVWRRWGFGESQGNPYANVRFPTDDYDIFAANYPFVGSSASGQTFADAIEALLLQLNVTMILAPHSMGGPSAVEAAKKQHHLVKGIVFLEPTGPPDESDFPALAGLHMYAPYADRISSRRQSGRKAGVEAAAVLFAQNGGMAEVVSLPDDLGIFGNTHLFMQDDNHEFIADLILNATSSWSSSASTSSPSPLTSIPTASPSVIEVEKNETESPTATPSLTTPAPSTAIPTAAPSVIEIEKNETESPTPTPSSATPTPVTFAPTVEANDTVSPTVQPSLASPAPATTTTETTTVPTSRADVTSSCSLRGVAISLSIAVSAVFTFSILVCST